MKLRSKVIALVSSIGLVLSPIAVLPASANGCGSSYGTFAGGSGSALDPFQIDSAVSFASMENNACLVTGYFFKLTADIDLQGITWTPIGTAFEFTNGGFDGDFHTVSNLSVSGTNVGLFGTLNGVTVKNLTISNAAITGTDGVAGSLAFSIKGTSFVNQVEVLSSVVSGTYLAGGLLGLTGAGSSVSVSEVAVDAAVSSSAGYAGGIVAQAENNTLNLSDSYFYGSVIAGGPIAGGIVGYGINATIARTYSVGTVTGGNSNRGGIIGQSITTAPSDSYYLDTSVVETGGNYGTSKTTTQLKDIATFASPWSITASMLAARAANPTQVWLLDPGLLYGYPVLMWQYKSGFLNAPCNYGTYSIDGLLPCVDAQPGKYVADMGATEAVPCPAGMFQPSYGARVCILNEPGTFGAFTGMTAAEPCPAGTWSEAGATECYRLEVSYQGPIISGLSRSSVSTGEAVSFAGSNLSTVSSVSVAGLSAAVVVTDGSISFIVPTGLAPGVYDLKVVSGFGVLVVQDALVVSSSAIDNLSAVAAWTKKLSDSSAKIYAKNLSGVGKVQFFFNGQEIAWVRAVDESDPKLRSANGASYLVRTVDLVSGKKNVLEIWVDGVRVKRVAYAR